MAVEPSALALFWFAVIAGAILVYVVLDGFDLGSGNPVRDHQGCRAAERDDGRDLPVLGWQRDLARGDRRVAVRRLSGRLRRIHAGVLHPGAAASVRADLPRRRFRVPLPRQCARIMGLGFLPRFDDRRFCSRRGGRRDDPRHPRRQRAVFRRPLRVAGASAGVHRHRSGARLRIARGRLARAEVRGRVARMGMAEGASFGRRSARGDRGGGRGLDRRARPGGRRRVSWPLLGFDLSGDRLVAMLGVFAGARRRRDGWPFAMTVLFFLSSFATLAVLFWPYMIPYSITVGSAAAPEASLSFLFWGAGLFVLPVIAIYTIAVYWLFRGKMHKGQAL